MYVPTAAVPTMGTAGAAPTSTRRGGRPAPVVPFPNAAPARTARPAGTRALAVPRTGPRHAARRRSLPTGRRASGRRQDARPAAGARGTAAATHALTYSRSVRGMLARPQRTEPVLPGPRPAMMLCSHSLLPFAPLTPGTQGVGPGSTRRDGRSVALAGAANAAPARTARPAGTSRPAARAPGSRPALHVPTAKAASPVNIFAATRAGTTTSRLHSDTRPAAPRRSSTRRHWHASGRRQAARSTAGVRGTAAATRASTSSRARASRARPRRKGPARPGLRYASTRTPRT